MLRMIANLTVILFTAISCTVASVEEKIGPEFDKIPEGLYAIYQLSGGAMTSAVYHGWTEKGYRVTVHQGDAGDQGELLDTRYHDNDGNLILYETPTETWSYKPHNCARTMGACRHVARNETKAQSFRWSRSTSRDGEQDFEFVRYYGDEEWASGTFRTDDLGLTIAFTNSRNGEPDSFGSMVRIVWP